MVVIVLPLCQPQFQIRAVRIKVFFGTSENVVKSHLWTALSVYVLVAIVKKRLPLSTTRYEMLQILSLTLCERMPWVQRLTPSLKTSMTLRTNRWSCSSNVGTFLIKSIK